MRTLFASDRRIPYDGTQLASHWILDQFGLLGEAMVAFIGPCDVDGDRLVDLADRRAGKPIFSPLMLHFICEFFDLDLEKTVLRQRLLVAVIREALQADTACPPIDRVGDDLFVEGAKLSVSIATLSPVSGLIHTGLNIKTENVPVPAAGLEALNVDPNRLAERVLERFSAEIDEICEARSKVRGVE